MIHFYSGEIKENAPIEKLREITDNQIFILQTNEEDNEDTHYLTPPVFSEYLLVDSISYTFFMKHIKIFFQCSSVWTEILDIGDTIGIKYHETLTE